MQRVLIIDDERSIGESLGMFLQEKGFEVLTSETGEGGLDLVQREKPDIVVLDLWLPGMHGLEVLKQVKMLDKDTEVIVITAHNDKGYDAAARALGACGYIHKPIDVVEFEATVDRAVRSRTARQLREP